MDDLVKFEVVRVYKQIQRAVGIFQWLFIYTFQSVLSLTEGLCVHFAYLCIFQGNISMLFPLNLEKYRVI